MVDYEYILKIELIRFSNGLNMGCKSKRSQGELQVLVLRHWTPILAEMWKRQAGGRLRKK